MSGHHSKPYDYVQAVIDYENGQLEQAQTIELFQHLIDNGMAWRLQGSYSRMAVSLLKSGLCKIPPAHARPLGSLEQVEPMPEPLKKIKKH